MEPDIHNKIHRDHYEKESALPQLQAMTEMPNLPSLFLTITPTDFDSQLRAHLNTTTVHKIDGKTFDKLLCLTADNRNSQPKSLKELNVTFSRITHSTAVGMHEEVQDESTEHQSTHV